MSDKQGERLIDVTEQARPPPGPVDSVYRAVREGWLPHYHLGPRLLRFDPNEVKESIEGDA